MTSAIAALMDQLDADCSGLDLKAFKLARSAGTTPAVTVDVVRATLGPGVCSLGERLEPEGDQVPYPDVLDPAVRSRTDAAHPFPVAGTVLLMLALAGAALLFVPPARLVGLVLVLPIGAALLYVWFSNQEQTNGALTVIGLAVLAVTLGVGVAMTIAARANPTQAGPPIELTSGGLPTRFAGPIHHLAPTQPLAPGPRLEPDNSASTPRAASPTHRPDQNGARTPTEPDPRQPNNNTGTLNAPPSPDSVRPNTDNTPDNNTNSNPTNDPESPDGRDGNLGSNSTGRDGNPSSNSTSRDSDLGSNSTSPDSNPSSNSTGTDSRPSNPRPDYCSLGNFKLNNDGTGDVCGDSDGQGHYLWRRHVPPPSDSHHHSHDD